MKNQVRKNGSGKTYDFVKKMGATLYKSNKCLYNKIMLEIERGSTIQEKLHILADAAKYDVACTSSGVKRKGKEGSLGNAEACGICHSFSADGRCVSLLKILLTNHCVFDCKYCVNRCSNDVPRAAFTPREICDLTIEFYRRNYIEGLFLSSGVMKSPDHTMEQMCEALRLLRTEYRFNGYVHVKAIPGASDELLAQAGCLADRVSVNLELPTAESLRQLAPHKSFQTILRPMAKLSHTIAAYRLEAGQNPSLERSRLNAQLPETIFRQREQVATEGKERQKIETLAGAYGKEEKDKNQSDRRAEGQETWEKKRGKAEGEEKRKTGNLLRESEKLLPKIKGSAGRSRTFAPAGQSTQMIIGASGESDYHLLLTTQRLYQSYDLKRVFYSAYIPVNEDTALPALGTPPPLLREHRLYQADWLLRFYGFQGQELLSPQHPDFHPQIDPKCDWAIRNLGEFPVEVQTAPLHLLLRIPGIGPKSARRIIQSRRYGKLSFQDLKKMGVVLKRAHYFLTCQGRMMYKISLEESFIRNQMICLNEKENWQLSYTGSEKQLSLFDDFHLK